MQVLFNQVRRKKEIMTKTKENQISQDRRKNEREL